MTRTVLAVADSDSFVKWAAATLERLGDGFDGALVVLRTPVEPHADQVAAAVAGTTVADRPTPVLALREVVRLLRTRRPDVVLVAATGPAAELVLRALPGLEHRPVVVTGLPGMSVPATELALRYRSASDLFVVHSHRERDEFAEIADRLGVPVRCVVSRLPFLVGSAGEHPAPDAAPVGRVVFAPQAKFPEEVEDRRAVLRSLGRLALAQPGTDVVLKLRGLAGQAQTHHEAWPMDVLRERMLAEPGVERVRVATGPLEDYLGPGSVLVTISSTAVLEAFALGRRALVLSDFGLGDANLTGVYVGSGVVGTLDDLEHGRFAHADDAWLERNYLHHEVDELPGALGELCDAAAAGTLGPVRAYPPVGGRLKGARRALRVALPRSARVVRQVATKVGATRRALLARR